MSFDPSAATVLVIDDDAEIRYSLDRVLGARNYKVSTAASGEEGLELAKKVQPDVVFLDNRMDGICGLETLQHLRNINKAFMIILMTAFGTTQTAIEAMKFGAFDYIVKPFDVKKVLSLTESAIRSRQDLAKASEQYKPLINSEEYSEGIVGSSEPMQEVFKVIGQVAASDVTVLVTGESGTGKELVARCIRSHSHRGNKPFMAVNCAAIPDNLIESELFGHERGAFTGATQQHKGKFELCDKGTLFLDEIGDMSLSTQTKILRALQEGEVQRLGSTETIKVDVRLVAATNKDLEEMVREKTFREDLYYRLNVVRIKLPSLRERLADVPELIDFMLQRMSKAGKTKVKRVSPEALAALMRHKWPGNVRELENVIQRSAIVAQGEAILPRDLPLDITEPTRAAARQMLVTTPPVESAETKAHNDGAARPEHAGQATPPPAPPPREPAEPQPQAQPPQPQQPAQPPEMIGGGDSFKPSLKELSRDDVFNLVYERLRDDTPKNILQAIEKEMAQRALAETGGNQVRTSAILGITRATLRKRIDQYQLRY